MQITISSQWLNRSQFTKQTRFYLAVCFDVIYQPTNIKWLTILSSVMTPWIRENNMEKKSEKGYFEKMPLRNTAWRRHSGCICSLCLSILGFEAVDLILTRMLASSRQGAKAIINGSTLVRKTFYSQFTSSTCIFISVFSRQRSST